MNGPVGRYDRAFLDAAAIAVELVRRPEVAARWTEPSALARMSVGALACHLGRQASRVAELVTVASVLPVLESADAHYDRAPWVTATSLDDPANDRTADVTAAAAGPGPAVERVVAALDAARWGLTGGAAQETVDIPWQGWSLRRDDFLLTRQVEVVTHSADLAASVALAAPEFPAAAFDPVRDLLVRLAVRRHGQEAVVGALTRRERTRPISAF